MQNLSAIDLNLFFSTLPLVVDTWRDKDPQRVHIESISIENTTLGDPLFQALLDCIVSIPSLHSLTILPATTEKWVMKDPQFIQLMDVLSTHCCPDFDSLRIPHQHISKKGLQSLLSLFQKNTLHKWYDLDLSYNEIGEKGGQVLASLFDHLSQTLLIQRLRVGGNKLRGSGGLRLLEALGSEERVMLQELDLSGETRRVV